MTLFGSAGLSKRTCDRAITAFAATVVLGVLAGCSSTPSPSTPTSRALGSNGSWTTRTVDGGQVSLSVPSDWNIGEAGAMGSFGYLAGSFSNQPLSPPCTSTANTLTCGLPLAALRPGGVLVDVSQGGFPLWSINKEPGTPTMVSGLPARVDAQSGAGPDCAGLGADLTRTEVIAFPNAPDNYFGVSICSRGVDGAVGARIIASIRVTPIG